MFVALPLRCAEVGAAGVGDAAGKVVAGALRSAPYAGKAPGIEVGVVTAIGGGAGAAAWAVGCGAAITVGGAADSTGVCAIATSGLVVIGVTGATAGAGIGGA